MAADFQDPEHHDSLDGIPSPAATFALHGHREQWDELVASHRGGRLHHAWLLQGPRGIGKATTAFALARHLLGPSKGEGGAEPVAAPDDPVARQIAQDSHPSLVHIERPHAERGTGFKTQITVDEIRRLNRFFRTTTSGGAWRIAVIDPADDMNRNAANALLKILEEPPERSLFLITSHSPGRLLPTIRSRCRLLRFEPLEEAALRSALHDLPLDVTESEIPALHGASEGSVRTAINLLESGGVEIAERVARLLAAPVADWSDIHAMLDALTQKGRETAYDLAVETLFKALADMARSRLEAGDKQASARLADFWRSEGLRFREGAAYNLDRKQMVLTFFATYFSLFRPAA